MYSAYDPELDRKVALKLLRATQEEERSGSIPPASARSDAPSGSSSPASSGRAPSRRSTSQARLLREAQAMAKLSNPNVVPVYDVGVFGDRVFVAMELIASGTLRTWLKTKRTRAEILRVFLDAGEGLAAAHAASLVHRDFKPDNVLVTEAGRAKVTDFGLVRAAGDRHVEASPASTRAPESAMALPLTMLGTVMGTPAYMAPEQHAASPTDARTDQYAFCVALYEALYGERPFVGTLEELARAKASGKVRGLQRARAFRLGFVAR